MDRRDEKARALMAERMAKDLKDVSQYNSTPGKGITRFPFTEEAMKALDHIEGLMKEAGLSTSRDESGAVIGRIEGETSRCILIESHYDTVMHGGAYDGMAGVVSGIEAAKLMLASGRKPYYSLEVMATNDEEGSRFSSGFFSSMAACGLITPEYCEKDRDKDGVSIADAMRAAGYDPERLPQKPRTDIAAVFEVHCEQGPVLENAGIDIGIVDAITGTHRVMVELFGRADHAGTTPMNMRADAMQAAARLITSVTGRAKTLENSVTTVGRMSVEPGIVNIVCAKASVWIDFRSTVRENINIMYDGIRSDLAAIKEDMGIDSVINEKMIDWPTLMDEGFKAHIEKSCEKYGFSAMHLPSGAGHDAQIFAQLAPAAMIFVPSIGGRSHCPEEKTDEKYLAEAVCVLYDTVEALNEEKSL